MDAYERLSDLGLGITEERCVQLLEYYTTERIRSNKFDDIFHILCNTFPELRGLNAYDEERVKTILEEAYRNDTEKYLIFETTKNGKRIYKGINHKEFSNDLIPPHHFLTLKDTDEVLFYEDGMYHLGGEAVIREECEKRLGELGKTYDVNEIIAHIKRSTFIDRKELNADTWTFNLKNGLLNIRTGDFRLHTPEHLSTIRIPVNYKPEMKGERIRKFFAEVLNEEDVPLMEEFFGYCLYPGYPFHKALMLVGSGSNGKSTMLNLLKAFLGKENIATTTIYVLEENRFATNNLFGKLALLNYDLPDKTLKQTGLLKSLTGEDLIYAEKKFAGCYSFDNYAKLIISCNKVPVTYDSTYAFFSRWIIVNFPNQFLQPIPDVAKEAMGNCKIANPNLIQELTTEDELSALLNIGIEGLQRLLANKGFSYSRTPEEIREEYMHLSEPIYGFINECCLLDPLASVTKSELYHGYVIYCKGKGRIPVTDNRFGRDLPRFVNVTTFTPRIRGARYKAWRGIRLVEKVTEVTEVTNILALNVYA